MYTYDLRAYSKHLKHGNANDKKTLQFETNQLACGSYRHL